jgi:hypothetical protein
MNLKKHNYLFNFLLSAENSFSLKFFIFFPFCRPLDSASLGSRTTTPNPSYALVPFNI